MRKINPEQLVDYEKYKITFERLKKYQPKVYKRLINYQLNEFIKLGTLKLNEEDNRDNAWQQECYSLKYNYGING